MREKFKAIWDYRFFIASSIKTEFSSRFARSKLGGLWMILHPLALVIVYAFILSKIMTAKLPDVATIYAYPIYILSGIVGWTLFSEILSRCMTVFIDNANLLKKISFPKLTLPLIIIGSSLVNFIILFFISFVIFGFLGHLPYHALHWTPLLVAITVSLATGIGLTLGVLNVFMRDIGQFMAVVLQFWFWLTPIVYMTSIMPKEYQEIILLNPTTGLIMGYQNVLLYDKAPDFSLLIYPSIFAVVSLVLSLIIFKKAGEEMADVL